MPPLLLAALLGAVAIAIAKRRPTREAWLHGPVQTPVPPCSRWLLACSAAPASPGCFTVTPEAARVATQLRALDEAHGNTWPLGKTYFYAILSDGGLYRFRVELHGPNEGNPAPHRGVGVTRCANTL